ncbi:MAG: carboxypeptidase regulatory-like domain-containing protein [Nitrospirae bacterium]|nr:carboxypeptidase regulatory-like domain-containing protein [Nitrospirota bacterium]
MLDLISRKLRLERRDAITRLTAGLSLICLLGLTGDIHEGAAYEMDQTGQGGALHGRVTFNGAIPQAERLRVPRDSAFCGSTILKEALHVEPQSHGVADAIVSIEGIEKGKPLPMEQAVTIENRRCRFLPRVQATTLGATLLVTNEDPILHNTRLRKETTQGKTFLNVALPKGVQPVQRTLSEPGLLLVLCAAHPFMRATIQVFEHPYFAVTDASGNFDITAIPPGTYLLRVWHETLGLSEQTLTIPEGEARTTMNVKLEF